MQTRLFIVWFKLNRNCLRFINLNPLFSKWMLFVFFEFFFWESQKTQKKYNSMKNYFRIMLHILQLWVHISKNNKMLSLHLWIVRHCLSSSKVSEKQKININRCVCCFWMNQLWNMVLCRILMLHIISCNILQTIIVQSDSV